MFFPKKSTPKKFLIFSQENVLLIFREIELSYVFFITSFSFISGNRIFWP